MKQFINKLLLAALLLAVSIPVCAQQTAAKQSAKAAKAEKAVSSAADDENQKTVLAKFTAWDKNLKSIKTDFEQTTSFEGTEISSSNGRLYKMGNNIRLDTLQNAKVTQSAVTDKKIIKILDDKGELITTLSWQEWQAAQANKALFDFGNYAEVLKTHKVKEFSKTGEQYKIVLEPASAPEKEKYLLEFILNAKDCFPAQISVSNQGIKTQTVLKNINKNVKLEERLFK